MEAELTYSTAVATKVPWNKGKMIGSKPPLTRDWPGRQLLRHPLAEADEGHSHLQANRQPASRAALARPSENREHCALSRNRGR